MSVYVLDCKFNCHKKCSESVPNNCQGEAKYDGKRKNVNSFTHLFTYLVIQSVDWLSIFLGSLDWLLIFLGSFDWLLIYLGSLDWLLILLGISLLAVDFTWDLLVGCWFFFGSLDWLLMFLGISWFAVGILRISWLLIFHQIGCWCSFDHLIVYCYFFWSLLIGCRSSTALNRPHFCATTVK